MFLNKTNGSVCRSYQQELSACFLCVFVEGFTGGPPPVRKQNNEKQKPSQASAGFAYGDEHIVQ